MATAVSICSNALLLLGENPINSFDDAAGAGGLDRARIASNLWDDTRRNILRSHPWNCAIKRVTLSPLTETPAFDYSYQFQLPSDWLRNVTINGLSMEQVDYEVESKKILINQGTVYLRYVYDNADVSSWDPMLTDAAILAMAARMAYPITQSDTREQSLLAQLRDHLRMARAVDGQDESPATFGSFDILNTRRAL